MILAIFYLEELLNDRIEIDFIFMKGRNYMIQAPNCINPYIQPIPAPSYNAVKIDVHNPQVNAPGQVTQPQYAPVTNPYYEYPQTQLYSYPQAQTQQNCQPCLPQQVVEPVQTQATAQTAAQLFLQLLKL